MNGNVFDIQRYSIHDGRGIRTVVFLKGCPLRCKWCSNPESQETTPTLCYSEATCIHCHTCVAACPNHEIVAAADGSLQIDWARCNAGPLDWTDCCPTNALSVKGAWMSPEDVMEEIRKDQPFYGQDGGVTFSGGEPLLQVAFVEEMAERCRREGITTAVETTGCVPWSDLVRVLPHMEMFLYDLKIMDPQLHRRWIGADNHLILENLRKLAETGADIMVRTPLIPGVNDKPEMVTEIMEFVKACGIKKYAILPFHQYGSGKYKACGIPYEMENVQPHSQDYVDQINQMIQEAGLSSEFGELP